MMISFSAFPLFTGVFSFMTSNVYYLLSVKTFLYHLPYALDQQR